MQYLVVVFPEPRRVLVDDEPQGRTHKLIQLPKGTHTVRIEPGDDARPQEITIELQGTSPLSPFRVEFKKA